MDALPLADDEVGLAVRAYVEADRAFADAVVAGHSPEPGLDVALEAHRLVDAAYRSAAERGSADRAAPASRMNSPPAASSPSRSGRDERRL